MAPPWNAALLVGAMLAAALSATAGSTGPNDRVYVAGGRGALVLQYPDGTTVQASVHPDAACRMVLSCGGLHIPVHPDRPANGVWRVTHLRDAVPAAHGCAADVLCGPVFGLPPGATSFHVYVSLAGWQPWPTSVGCPFPARGASWELDFDARTVTTKCLA